MLKIRLPDDAEKAFISAAKNLGMSKNALATLAVRNYLDNIEVEVVTDEGVSKARGAAKSVKS